MSVLPLRRGDARAPVHFTFPPIRGRARVTDRLIVAYGLMLVLAAWLGAVIWWKFYHSRQRVYERQHSARRKKDLAAARARDEGDVLS